MSQITRALVCVAATCGLVLATSACSDDGAATGNGDAGDAGIVDTSGDDDAPSDATVSGPTIFHDYTRAGGFYASPFPNDNRLVDGVADVSDFPNPENIAFVRRVRGMLDGVADGFGLSSGIFFALSEPIELPDLDDPDTVDASSPAFIIGVDDGAPDYGRRYPFRLAFTDDGGPFGAPNLLSLIPVQGVPFRPRTTYAAVILRDLAAGDSLVASAELSGLLAGNRPEGMSEAAFATHQSALEALDDLDIEVASIVGLAVFTTWDPVEELLAVRDQVLESDVPAPLSAPTLNEVFDDFCVFESTIMMPTFQAGDPPFAASGGGWDMEGGRAVSQGMEEANLVVTVPRAAMPSDGFPMTVFLRVGGGGERPLVDRGRRAEPGGEAIEPGTGPARDLARAGFAGLSIDGPHGGLRNVTNGDEQLLIFNVGNPLALRDNIRQSAVEGALTAHIVAELEVDPTGCPGVTTPDDGPVRFDTDTLALMGHSMGATIAIPTAAAEPSYDAVILSGCGGSYIENLVYKLSPLPARPIAENILRYTGTGRDLVIEDPVLSLLQWAGEPSDPPVYGRLVVPEPEPGTQPRHVLMLQGIVDTYILPPIANAASLSMELDLAGAALDADHAELTQFVGLEARLPFVGAEVIDLPVSGNQEVGGASATAIVVQHPEDGVEDGHEIAFQTEAPKHQYRCFLESLAAGLPRVPVGGAEDAPCN